MDKNPMDKILHGQKPPWTKNPLDKTAMDKKTLTEAINWPKKKGEAGQCDFSGQLSVSDVG